MANEISHTRADAPPISGAPGVPGASATRRPTSGPDRDGDDGPLFDWVALGQDVRFVLGAPRRHPGLAAAILAGVLAVTAGLLVLLPRSYYTEARILASRNLIMPALGNPNRSIPLDADAPTRAAAETILRRDNLLVLMDQTDLLEAWQKDRPLLARARDWAVALVSGKPDVEEQRKALVYLLEKRLKVTTGDGVITIGIDWPDPRMAYRLVTLAQQNFLETRHAIEVSTIAEAISILEGHAATARARVDTAMGELEKERASRRTSPSIRRPAAVAAESAVSPEAANLKVMLVAKRRALQDLEEYRQRRLVELQSQLTELTASYTPSHPLVVATTESIQSLQKDSPQLVQLRRDERDLVAQLAARGASAADLDAPAPGRRAPSQPVAPAFAREARQERESETVQYWRTQLDYALQKYESLAGRIEAARIELDTARAAFAYRYVVVRPAEVTKKPSKPNVPFLVLAGLAGGVVLAVLGTAFLDFWRGVLPRPWGVGGLVRHPVAGPSGKG